jgi:Tfp pilus assembly protein PilF
MIGLAGCAVNRYSSNFDFAAKLAQEGLWNEAYYRLQKAKAEGVDSALLHNNMAVVLEGLSRWPEAEEEYQRAMKLDPANEQIKENYDRLRKLLKKDKPEEPKEGKNEK